MARILRAGSAGEPGSIAQPRLNWAPLRKPMRAIRSIRTLRKVDQAVGETMPESRNLLMRAGVGVRQRAVSVRRQAPLTPPGTRAGTKTIAPPSPTSGGGVRSPFRRGRGT